MSQESRPIPEHADTAFAQAIEDGDVETVESLLRQYPSLVNSPDWTPPPLHCAVLWNQPKVAEVLLDHGADIERRDPDRNTTAIRYAVVFCKPDLIPLLLSRGARTDFTDEGETTLRQLAIRASQGAFEEYEDLPRPPEYRRIVEQLEQLGVE